MKIYEILTKYIKAKSEMEKTKEELDTFIGRIIKELKELRVKYSPISLSYDILLYIESGKWYDWEIEQIPGHPTMIKCIQRKEWGDGYGISGSDTFTFPINFVTIPTTFIKWKEDLDIKYKNHLSKTQDIELQRKRNLFNKLKKELGEE